MVDDVVGLVEDGVVEGVVEDTDGDAFGADVAGVVVDVVDVVDVVGGL